MMLWGSVLDCRVAGVSGWQGVLRLSQLRISRSTANRLVKFATAFGTARPRMTLSGDVPPSQAHKVTSGPPERLLAALNPLHNIALHG